MRYLYAFVLLLLHFVFFGQVIIDEDFNDWNNVQFNYTDSSDDGKNDLDFGYLKVTNDSKYLYLSFTTGKKINLQNSNDISIFIDIDNNENTGYKINGIGADISYFFGDRYGFYYRNSNKYSIYHQDIELITLPTVTSNTFELAIKRKFQVGSYLINISNTIKTFILQDTPGGDIMPDETGGFEYIFSDEPFETPNFSIEKLDREHLRIMSYNVEKDNYFANEPPYKRLIKAIEPDILCFQEIYNHSSANVYSKIKSYFGGTWYHAKQGSDLIIVSRYPIIKSRHIGGNGAFLIDKNGKEVLIVIAHLYCCDKDSKRQKEVDEIMEFIRDAKNNVGQISIEKNTPIVILGDMNFVGSDRQRKTLIEGDISNESTYGNDFLPDWDLSYFEDAKPLTTGFPATFTWNSESSGYPQYPKGRLDYVIYSGSILQKENAYVLFTRILDYNTLDKYQLNAKDSDNAADHFPVVVDFTIKNSIGIEDISEDNRSFKIINYYPNPTKDYLNIIVQSNKKEKVLVTIFDNFGRLISSEKITLNYGKTPITIDTKSLPQGIYFVKIIKGKEVSSIKFVVE